MHAHRASLLLAVAAALATGAPAQRGDRKGEVQRDVTAGLDVPPAPVLTPTEALAAFTVADGYRVELVAAEPLVEDPVAVTFGPDGRLWVVEMRGFMPNVDGEGEREPNGCIAVLEDTDGDGRMDRRSVFLDGLVLPRAVALVADGVLVIEPPELVFWRDTDGDGRGDERSVVSGGFQAGLGNVEHAGNGLVHGIDNWIYLANFGRRFRWTSQGWRSERAFLGGQWGLSHDDWGRFFYNYNSDQLRVDLYPSHYAVRNGHHGVAKGVNHRAVKDQRTWPIRVTPGINRGYQQAMLRDGRLARFTAVCGPGVARGGVAGLDGSVFVCEPAGNFVRRNVITERDGVVSGTNPHGEAEFLASVDERFRPVNACTGPDGALYVVDMYRGIVQHRNFVTTFLRKQIVARGLDRPLGLGRIWRVVPAAGRGAARSLDGASVADLVAALEDPNGWCRDTAQRLLVERGDRGAAPALRALARGSDDPRARIHALWTLEGIVALSRDDAARALEGTHPRVRATGVRLLEAVAGMDRDAEVRARLAALVDDDDAPVRWQVALTAGAFRGEFWDRLVADLVTRHPDDAHLRGAVLSGLEGRELEHLARLLGRKAWRANDAGRAAHLRAVARCVAREADPARVYKLLALFAEKQPAWRRSALAKGVLAALPRGDARARSLPVAIEPTFLRRLPEGAEASFATECSALLAAARWPGLAGAEVGPVASAPYEAGRKIYTMLCAACHQADGRGLAGLAPPLLETEWVAGPPGRLVRIVLHGLTGPVAVAGERHDLLMPGLPHLTDEQVAAVLTYVRDAFAPRASSVSAEAVTRVRAANEGRVKPWTVQELLKIR